MTIKLKGKWYQFIWWGYVQDLVGFGKDVEYLRENLSKIYSKSWRFYIFELKIIYVKNFHERCGG